MTPHKQLNRHNPPHVIGDCWRTCIACLLDMHPRRVPHFLKDWDGEKCYKRTVAWLQKRGILMFHIPLGTDKEKALEEFGGSLKDKYWIFSGQSKNGCGHVVVCCGNEIVHDPALDNSGIVAPGEEGQYIGILLTGISI